MLRNNGSVISLLGSRILAVLRNMEPTLESFYAKVKYHSMNEKQIGESISAFVAMCLLSLDNFVIFWS